MFYYLYKITNQINNKEYIGVHKHKSLNNSYYGSGVAIKAAIKKYGKVNFKKEIIMLADNYTELLELEQIAVNSEYVKSNMTYNLREGGMGSEGVKGKDNPFYNKKHTDEVKNKLSTLASQRTGNKNHFYGLAHTENSKSKISKAKTGSKNEAKRTGEWITPYGVFRTYREAAKQLNLSTGTIKRRCKILCDKPVGFNYQIPVEFRGEKTWRQQGWYFKKFGQE